MYNENLPISINFSSPQGIALPSVNGSEKILFYGVPSHTRGSSTNLLQVLQDFLNFKSILPWSEIYVFLLGYAAEMTDITFISEQHFGLVSKLSFAARPCNLDRCID